MTAYDPATTRAYFETCRDGLVPVRILYTWRDRAGQQKFLLRSTAAKRHAYPRGYEWVAAAPHVIPRPCVRRHRYSTTIMPYEWEGKGEDEHHTEA